MKTNIIYSKSRDYLVRTLQICFIFVYHRTAQIFGGFNVASVVLACMDWRPYWKTAAEVFLKRMAALHEVPILYAMK